MQYYEKFHDNISRTQAVVQQTRKMRLEGV